MYPLLPVLMTSAAFVLAGCTKPESKPDAAVEGVLFSVEYEMGDGTTGGGTRLNESKAVPGRNGSWNVDARGRLTPELLVITRPRQPDLGPQVIPVHRLVSVQFGDGGVKRLSGKNP